MRLPCRVQPVPDQVMTCSWVMGKWSDEVVFTRTGRVPTDDGKHSPSVDDAIAQRKSAMPSAEVLASWTHPRVASGPLADEIAKLKAEPGEPILAHGGSSFARDLVRHGVADEFRLAVHPVALGRGLPLFSDLEKPLKLKLIDVKRFPKGTAVHVYRPRS